MFCIHQTLERKGEFNGTVHKLFINLKEVYDSVRRDILYNILTEFSVLMKLARPIKMCLNETYSEACTRKHLSDAFHIQNGPKNMEIIYHHCSVICHQESSRKQRGTGTEWNTFTSGLCW
jgi:hypothetical protein